MPKINKKAQDFLPEDLQVAINTFIEQFNIMEEYDLEHIPSDYVANLLETMGKYPEYNNATMGLMEVLQRDDL